MDGMKAYIQCQCCFGVVAAAGFLRHELGRVERRETRYAVDYGSQGTVPPPPAEHLIVKPDL